MHPAAASGQFLLLGAVTPLKLKLNRHVLKYRFLATGCLSFLTGKSENTSIAKIGFSFVRILGE
jgi:hypothetical protein